MNNLSFGSALVIVTSCIIGVHFSAQSVWAVSLVWDANVESDLAGYNLYYGELNSSPLKIDAGKNTSVSVSGLLAGRTYYFYVTAYSTAGLESDPSDGVTYTIPFSESGPSISDIADQVISMNSSTADIPFTVNDPDTALSDLTLTAKSSNADLVPNSNIFLAGSGMHRTIRVTPAAGQSGAATITVAVDDGTESASDTFVLKVTQENTAPSISEIGNQSIDEDNSTGPINFTVDDDITEAGRLVASGSSSNPALVPNGNILFGGSGADRTVSITPLADQFGSATITVRVTDGDLETQAAFALMVNAVNDPPAISDVANQTVSEDNASGPISFTVSDIDSVSSSLVITGSSSNAELVENPRITFGGVGTNRTVRVMPSTNQFGTVTITVRVSDESLTAADTFLLTVNPVNDAPVVSGILNQTINEDASTGAIAFGVSDPESASTDLFVSVRSSNSALVPDENMTLAGSGSNRTVSLKPLANQFGNATITVTTSDGTLSGSTSFLLTVNPVNDVPAVSDIGNQTINEDSSTALLSFTIADIETDAGSLSVSGSSSNSGLVVDNSIIFGGSGANRTVKLTPVANQFGAATITVRVSDGTATTSDAFVLTVNPINDSPSISDIGNQTSNEDTPAMVNFVIHDIETAPAGLAISGTSSDPALVANGSIVFSGSGTNRTVTVTPQTNQWGTATITLRVTDGELSAIDTFALTINPVNDPPTISDITNRTIYQNSSTGPINFTIGDVESSASNLAVSGRSANPTLVPNSNIVFLGNGAERSVTVTPAPLQTGTATIIITVSDGDRSTDDSFVLTVNPVLVTGGAPPPPAGLPLDSPSPRIGINIEQRQIMLQVKGLPANSYLIETSTDLRLWSPLGVVQSPTGISYFEDARRSPQRFYRVREDP